MDGSKIDWINFVSKTRSQVHYRFLYRLLSVLNDYFYFLTKSFKLKSKLADSETKNPGKFMRIYCV